MELMKLMPAIALSAHCCLSLAAQGPGTFFVPPAGTANVAAGAPKNEKALVSKTVAFLGGSITEMHGFRPRVMKLLREKYPQAEFREIAAGLSSTCSDAGAFRMEEGLLAHGVPDLLVVEEAVNDEQDGHFDRKRCIRGLEGIVRRVRSANAACEVVVGLMVNKGQYDRLMAGETPVAYAAHADVATHYGAALADVGRALVESARQGGISWKEYRDCHPSPEGCDFGAKVVMAAVEKVFNPMRRAAAKPMPPPMDEFSYWRGRAIRPAELRLGAGWNASRPDWDRVPGSKRGHYCRGEAVWSETPGAVLEVPFTGTALAAFLTAGPDAGDLEVSVDGGAWRPFRLRADYGQLHYPYVQTLADELSAGAHVARLRVLPAARGGKTASAVRIHRLYVNGLSEFHARQTTAEFQRLIDAASARGGGTVTIPPGNWILDGLELKSDVTLELPEGCCVEATTNWTTWPCKRAFLYATKATNVTVRGKGVVDVHGERYPFYDSAPGRVMAAFFTDVRNLKLYDFELRRSATWTLNLQRCEDVHVKGVKIRSTVNFNNDGIDIEAKRCLIEDCDIDSDDDAICFKPNSRGFATEDVEVRNCLISSSCNFIKFGTTSFSPVRRVNIHDCKIFARTHSQVRDYERWRKKLPGGIGDFANGLSAIALEVVDGGSMEDVTIRDVEISGCQTPIFIRHGARHPRTGGFLRNVLIENVKGSCVSRIASSITGVPSNRVENVTLRNLDITYPGGATAEMLKKPVPECEKNYPENWMFRHVLPGWAFYLRHADGIRFENVKVRLASEDARKSAIVADDATWTADADCSF